MVMGVSDRGSYCGLGFLGLVVMAGRLASYCGLVMDERRKVDK